ncbi:serine hydrolase [Streptomyces cyaneofuscatus]
MKRRSAVAVLLFLTIALATVACSPGTGRAGAATPGTRPSPASSKADTPPGASASPTAASPEQSARAALDALTEHDGRYALAVEDLTSGRSLSYGSSSSSDAFVSASIIKVDILAALLLQAQDRGGGLTLAQQRLASAMIRYSDNDAAQELWVDIGRRQGLNAANMRFGFSRAHASQRGMWGLTRTTIRDQIALLKAVFTRNSPLTSESRTYVRTLMSDVIAEQGWGVGAASSANADRVLKNGWLPRETTNLWVVNSLGLVEYRGHSLLVAVLTDDQLTREAGISLVERTAITAVHTLVDNSENNP